MKYTNIGDKIIALAKVGYATNNVNKDLMKNIANWARTNTTGWTLSATDPKTGTIDPSWSPNQEDWSDVYDFAVSKGNNELMDYLVKSGYYFKKTPVQNVTPATPQGASSVNNPMQPSQAVVTQEAMAAGTWDSTPVITQPTIMQATVEREPIMNESTTVYADPLVDANARFAEFEAASIRAGENAISAEMAYANSIINSGGIWKVLQPIAEKQMQDSLSVLEKTSAIAKANVEASRTALNAQEAADYAEVIDTIDKNLAGARKRTTEDMNARGLYFSTVLDSVMGQVEAASSTERAHAAGQSKARYAKIASEMAIMSGNIDIEVLKGNAAAVAQYTAQMLQVVAQDEQTKQEMAAIVAKLSVQKAGVADAIAAQIFGQKEQMRSNAIQEGYQIEDRAIAAEDRQTGIDDKAKQDWLSTINQFAGDFQAEINRISNDNDSTNDWQIPYLKAARVQKISDQLVAQAAADADKAKADALKAYQDKQLTWTEYNAVTARINAAGSATGTTKYEKPDGGTSGSFWTPSSAISFTTAYDKLVGLLPTLPSGTLDTTNGNDIATTIMAAGGDANQSWTKESLQAYLDGNRAVYDTAKTFVNKGTGILSSTTVSPLINDTIRQAIEKIEGSGVPVNKESFTNLINDYYNATSKQGVGQPNPSPDTIRILNELKTFLGSWSWSG